jgi:kynurenine formamidase
VRQYAREDIEHLLHDRSNWGRWGVDDQRGALNLVTADKRLEAAALVRSGRSVSLSRPFPSTPAPDNPRPAAHYVKRLYRNDHAEAGAVVDYYGIEYHGLACTHVDALCHVWDERGIWNGKQPDEVLSFDGTRWGSISKWSDGIMTRGVLLDVPAHRGTQYVTHEAPVYAEELATVAAGQGVTVGRGDALVVYSGRERWDQEHPRWGSERTPDGTPMVPGLHGSCLEYLRDTDVAVLAWDMQECVPNEWGLPWTIHGAIFAYGIAIVDNCALDALASACREEGRYEFMFVVSPLVVEGGTGSPANPLAVF